MSRSYRGKFAKTAGLVFLIFIAFGFFSSLVWRSASLENEATQRSEIYRQNAENRIKWVCGSAAAAPDCVDQTRQAQRENEREEQDLAAQKITAWWTKVMGIAALIGMALSAIGVWLVKTTFDETRTANEIALFGQGADLIADGAEIEITPEFVTIGIMLSNVGAAMAHDVSGEGTLKFYSRQPILRTLRTFSHVLTRTSHGMMDALPRSQSDRMEFIFGDGADFPIPLSAIYETFSSAIGADVDWIDRLSPALEMKAKIKWQDHMGRPRGVNVAFVAIKVDRVPLRAALMAEIKSVTHSKA